MKNIHKKLSVHLSKAGTNGELRTPLNFVTFTNENKSDIISVFPGELPAFKYVLLCSCSHMHSNWLQHGFYWFKTLSCQDKHKYTKIKILKALLFLKIWIDTEVSIIIFLNITLAFLSAATFNFVFCANDFPCQWLGFFDTTAAAACMGGYSGCVPNLPWSMCGFTVCH